VVLATKFVHRPGLSQPQWDFVVGADSTQIDNSRYAGLAFVLTMADQVIITFILDFVLHILCMCFTTIDETLWWVPARPRSTTAVTPASPLSSRWPTR
jgi:hypothetical protein